MSNQCEMVYLAALTEATDFVNNYLYVKKNIFTDYCREFTTVLSNIEIYQILLHNFIIFCFHFIHKKFM